MSMEVQEFDKLFSQYQSYKGMILDKTIEDIIALKESGEISNELASKLIALLISRHVAAEIRSELQDSGLNIVKSRGKKLTFMGIQYGRRDEYFAVQ